MQSAGKRKNLRRAITYRAYIDVGVDAPAHECTLCDASQEGAMLLVTEPIMLPAEFTLALSTDGAARRRCRIRWRRPGRVGVEFLKGFNEPPRPVQVTEAVFETVPAQPSEPDSDTAVEAPADWIDIDTLSRS